MAKKKIIAAGVAAATAAGVVAAKKTDIAKKVKRSAESKTYHITQEGDSWVVKADGAARASSKHSNKRAALSAGRELANKNAPSELIIHGSDGKVQRSHTYEVA